MNQSELLFTEVSSTSGDLLFVDDVSVKISPTIVNDGNLLFNDNAATDGNLLFAGQAIIVVVQDVTAVIDGSFPALTLDAHVGSLLEIELQSSFPALNIVATGVYDSDTARPLVSRLQTKFNTATTLAVVHSSIVKPLRHASSGATTEWSLATSFRFGAKHDIRQLNRLRRAATMTWMNAVPLCTRIQSRFRDLDKNAATNKSAFSNARPVQMMGHIQFADRQRQRLTVPSHWRSALPMRLTTSDKFSSGTAYRVRETERFQTAIVPPIGISYVPGVKPPIVYVGDANLVFAEPVTTSSNLVFGNTYVTPGSMIVVPVRRTYIVLNNVQLRRVDGNHILPATSLQLKIDWDSWTWSFSASLPRSAISLIEPGVDGDTVILEAMVNGQYYRLIAEDIQSDRQFGQATISVSGRGISAQLSEKYSPTLTFANSTDRTAQQLMNDALKLNGISLGWEVDWRIYDWVVPAGAWSHYGTYMSAVNEIAAAAGAFIQPDPVAQILRVRAKYPSAPWNWGGTTPDIELPSAVVAKEAISWIDNPVYNSVYVSGSNSAGILGYVKRQGTAGDKLAPMITDALITSPIAARQRGIVTLAETGRNTLYSLSLPVLAETGIIEPGSFVRYVDSHSVMGIVKGVSINASGNDAKVRQTIEVLTHG
ncbi:hypothetical protein KDM87_14325 [Undibacterium sp. FT147W]|uniref:Uncharacterized protein n=1 Tax=Undibacterium rivi TaxID=2828729 RepID=A0ABS5H5D7_9BURK|nr:hypothetical protein [Undibacterium rivi]MBR7793772.1 hypothetical protein [Undibacterium rivi]